MTEDRRIPLPDRGERLAFTFEGETRHAHAGETIAAALWADGVDVLRASSRTGAPRGVFCNMGICFECLVQVEGKVVRACTTLVREGIRVERGGRP